MAKSTKQQQPSDSKMVSSELFILTYGALVNDLISDLESPEEVNRQLDKIGYNMGLRLADDFLSKNPRIGVIAQSNQIGNAGDEFSLIIDQNPLTEFVEKPVEFKDLCYSQVICGCIRGALEAMHMEVQVTLVADLPDPTELRIKFHRILHESIPAGDEL
uniref:Trafficking protein particle complex subunit n=1 Tax=Meloidogyne floridensis TaxID=298350 RepID=A0A915NZ42_9BILA